MRGKACQARHHVIRIPSSPTVAGREENRMSENGKIPDSELAEIPGGRLTKEAAANWLAMRQKGGQELGVWIAPIGPRGSYRTYDEQVYFWQLYQSGKGNLAARPGTSNHGL